MSRQWHYSKQKQRFGPVTDEQLQSLTQSGEIQPCDLVWTKGMANWMPAHTIKGLAFAPLVPAFSSPATDSPPVFLKDPSRPPLMTAGLAKPTTGTPALWNPNAAACWGLPLSWAFSSFLLARNWKMLGNEARARRCMIWFYSIFPCILLAFLIPGLPSGVSIAILVAFYFLEVKPQTRFVKEQCGDEYIHKSWWKPLGIASGTIVGILVLAAAGSLVGGGGKVYNGSNEIESLIYHKTQQDVVAILGKPDSIFSGGVLVRPGTPLGGETVDDEVWTYWKILQHPATGQAQSACVHFAGGRCIAVTTE